MCEHISTHQLVAACSSAACIPRPCEQRSAKSCPAAILFQSRQREREREREIEYAPPPSQLLPFLSLSLSLSLSFSLSLSLSPLCLCVSVSLALALALALADCGSLSLSLSRLLARARASALSLHAYIHTILFDGCMDTYKDLDTNIQTYKHTGMAYIQACAYRHVHTDMCIQTYRHGMGMTLLSCLIQPKGGALFTRCAPPTVSVALR